VSTDPLDSNSEPGSEGPPGLTGDAAGTAESKSASVELTAENALTISEPVRYTRRLATIYLGLGIVVAASLTGLGLLVVKPAATTTPAWSKWKPEPGNVGTMTKQISDRVASQYRVSEAGGQLVAVIPSGPSITNGNNNVPLKAIAIRRVPQSNTGIRILGTDKTRLFTLCGLGSNCSIQGGTPSAQRGRLVRREALEAALYTFKFVPSVDSVIAFMPPAPGSTTNSVLFLEKEALKDQLKEPLSKTLPLATPPLPSAENLAEQATIDKLTLKNIFSYEYTALQTGGAAIILDPST
jgi:hypothetical protein